MYKKEIKFFKNNGFTLVELMIVIAIIGTLAGIAVPSFQNYIQRAKKVRIISELKIIEKELISYKLERGVFPDSLADIGLDTLRDPWGNPYRYLRIEGTQYEDAGGGNAGGGNAGGGNAGGGNAGGGNAGGGNAGGGNAGGGGDKPRKDHFMHPVNTDFDLYSMGPDGKSNEAFTANASRDDFVRANNGQYLGLASEY